MPDYEIEEIIVSTFLGYKYRKTHDLLYSNDARVPLSLIKMYYTDLPFVVGNKCYKRSNIHRLDIKDISSNFVNRYVKNESIVEGVHNENEIKGHAVMYDLVHKMDENEFELFSIIELHRALYSKSSIPEVGGIFRNAPAFLREFAIELSAPENIFNDLLQLEDVVTYLKIWAVQMRETQDYSSVREYIKECMKLKCKLLQIHPFVDGNGRTVRCFINKLFEIGGIPPVYITKAEKDEYKRAISEAQRYRGADEIDDDSKYDLITNFYLYKVCDSIIELDINKRLSEERKEGIYEHKKIRRKKPSKK